MKLSRLRELTLRQIADGIRNDETSPTELVTILLQQVQRTDEKVKAYVTICGDKALELARAAELQLKAGYDLGLLHGIPVSIKDLFETAGIRTTCGSKLMQNYTPTTDCTAVTRLKQAGAIIFGKTNTHEFALGGITPPTRNPWNLNHIPGGSSGGSAAAIAAGSALVATGSDTLGSIRIPASSCGVVGLKPTYGRVSRAGVFPESWSLDHVGPITRRVEDAAIMLSVMAGYDELDPTSSQANVPDYLGLDDKIEGVKIGVPKNYFFERCDKEVRKAVNNAIDRLQQLGCQRVEFEFPYVQEIGASLVAIDACESAAYHERSLAERADEYSPDVRLQLEQALFIPATYYIQALRTRGMILPTVLRIFKQCDVIVTPTLPSVAPEVDARKIMIDGVEEQSSMYWDTRYVAAFNLTGLPAISVPCGFAANGLPIGMQIVGNRYDELTILRLAHAYENATVWHNKFPELG